MVEPMAAVIAVAIASTGMAPLAAVYIGSNMHEPPQTGGPAPECIDDDDDTTTLIRITDNEH
jgi:hypothetical protein